MNLAHLSGKSLDELEDMFDEEEDREAEAKRIKAERDKRVAKQFKQENQE